jgi:DNA-binding NarL/FixJ family response regulator
MQPSKQNQPTCSDRPPVRVLIVDDMAHVRAELRQLLDLVETIQVVGEAADGQAALEQAQACRPDVVLMDLEMPRMNGREAALQIKARGLARKVIILSIHADLEEIQRCLQAGADEFIPKGEAFERLVQAILQAEY